MDFVSDALFDGTGNAAAVVEVLAPHVDRVVIAKASMSDPLIRQLMTLPGVDMAAASGVAAAIGDVRRFEDPTKLVGYLGLKTSLALPRRRRRPVSGCRVSAT